MRALVVGALFHALPRLAIIGVNLLLDLIHHHAIEGGADVPGAAAGDLQSRKLCGGPGGVLRSSDIKDGLPVLEQRPRQRAEKSPAKAVLR